MNRLRNSQEIASDSDTQAVVDLLSKLSFDRSCGLQRQITDRMRDLIRSSQLTPGTRIPSIQGLANLWESNHFTVQKGLKPLVEEGLLERQPRIGTRVRKPPTTRCFGMYLGQRIFSDQGRFFYMTLYVHLHTALAEAGYQLKIWIDSRDPKMHNAPPADMQAAIDKREIRGLIAPGIREEETFWLKKLPIPVVGFGAGDTMFANTIIFDQDAMLSFFLDSVRKEGCTKVAFICPLPELAKRFHCIVKEKGMETRSEWIPESHVEENSEFGAMALQQIWALDDKPQALVVFPDTCVKGALESIWKLGIKIPEQLRLCLHRNEGIDVICPFPAHWAETSLTELSKAFFRVLVAKNEGNPLQLPVQLPFVFTE